MKDMVWEFVDKATRIISWNVTGEESGLWDIAIAIAGWFS